MPLTQDEIRALLEEKNEKGELIHQDVLTPAIQKEDTFFRHSVCPKCGGASVRPFIDPHRPFVPGNPLPNKLLQCLQCETEFNPYTGLITRVTAE
jgi:hypothetical protein